VIDRQEIMEFAREMGIDPNVVEKDYVLGWLLAGISHHPLFSSHWVFKGGTCLKKCFFETYRFSEDLDFTVINSDHLDQDSLTTGFKEIARWVYDATGIEMPEERIRFESYKNVRGHVSIEGRISYRGPLQRRGDPPRIKLDLTGDELLVLEPVLREVHHPYSDRPEGGIHILCYCFEEVFAEKLRALAERERPRDLYDVVHLYKHDFLRPDQAVIMATLEKKCAFKGIAVPTMAFLESKPERAELEAEWENMLSHQLPVLPPFDHYWQEIPALFDWLHGALPAKALPPIPIRPDIDTTWQPPAMAQAWHAPVPLEIIRFAASNRLCVDLEYQGTWRLIEPYSLRRTRDGNLLLFAVRHETGESRAYRVDRIQGAKATNVSFVPKYMIELTPSGPMSAPSLTRQSRDLKISAPKFSKSAYGRLGSKGPSYGPTYIIQCSYCGKKFNRKEYGTSLNPHKDKQGYPCPGRIGYLVDTKY
jgi:predicted nucleotidyltransferase component of viral defense system